MPILETRSISKTYTAGSRKIAVLDSVSLAVADGEFLVVQGESGSGKSTLLSILSGLDSVDSGRVLIDGRDITDCSEDELAPLRNSFFGFVFQSFHLVPSLTALENIMFPAELRGDLRAREKAEELLRRVGLSDRGSKLSPPALGRREAALRHLPRAGERPADHLCRRAHGQPRFHERRRRARTAPGAPPGAQHHTGPGHAQPGDRGKGRARRAAARRKDRFGQRPCVRFRLVRRQLTGSLHQAAIFVLCVVLSLVTLVSLSGFSQSVHSSFLKDARALHAADIIIHAHSPLSEPLLRQLSVLEKERLVASARVHEFYSVVRTSTGDASLLSNLKVVDPGYPFYGSVQLASGRQFRDVLTRGSIVVEQALLDRLHLRIGDRVRIGRAAFTISDVVLMEPDRPVNFFSLGPRVFIPGSDLASLDLVGKGSRVNYTILVKVMDEKDLDEIALRLKAASLPDRERVETYRTADSGVKRFFDNFLFFLNLIGIFTLLLAGIGIQSSLTAFLDGTGADHCRHEGSRRRKLLHHQELFSPGLGPRSDRHAPRARRKHAARAVSARPVSRITSRRHRACHIRGGNCRRGRSRMCGRGPLYDHPPAPAEGSETAGNLQQDRTGGPEGLYLAISRRHCCLLFRHGALAAAGGEDRDLFRARRGERSFSPPLPALPPSSGCCESSAQGTWCCGRP